MEIKYLKYLQSNPRIPHATGEMSTPDRPIPLSEIEQLEQLYNNGVPFPKALRELLFLAGDSCNELDYGPTNNQQELQEFFRWQLSERGITLPHPFYAIERESNASYSWVYLNQGDNPVIFCGEPGAPPDPPSTDWFYNTNQTIPEYVNSVIDRAKAGLPWF